MTQSSQNQTTAETVVRDTLVSVFGRHPAIQRGVDELSGAVERLAADALDPARVEHARREISVLLERAFPGSGRTSEAGDQLLARLTHPAYGL